MLNPSAQAPRLKIAIYRTSSIGDVVLATALLDLLKHLNLPAEIYWIGREPSLSLLANSYPEIDFIEIKSADERSDQLAKVEKLPHLHFIVDLQKSLRSHFICRYLAKTHKAPVYTWDKALLRRSQLVLEARLWGRRRELPIKALVAERRQYQMMVDALRQALKKEMAAERLFGLETYDAIPSLPIGDSPSIPSFLKEVSFGRWLALAPGAAHETKRAPMAVVLNILKLIASGLKKCNLSQKDLGLLILGDDTDRAFAIKLLDQISWHGPILNIAGKTSLSDTAFALKESCILLSNDSSLAHIAEAAGTPVAVLFGPTVEGFGFGPRMPQSKAHSALLGCRPCSKHGKTPCRYGDQACFHKIDQQQVADHCLKFLTTE